MQFELHVQFEFVRFVSFSSCLPSVLHVDLLPMYVSYSSCLAWVQCVDLLPMDICLIGQHCKAAEEHFGH